MKLRLKLCLIVICFLLVIQAYPNAEATYSDSEFAIEISDRDILSLKISEPLSRSFSVSKATAYAKSWAWSRNTAKYHSFFNGDCANFTSQIKEAGGVNQVSSTSVWSGRWHKLDQGTHKHSRSWTMADSFKKHFGYTYKFDNFNLFSQQIRPGDFIGQDIEKDGLIDHVGYVTMTGMSGIYNDKYYKDFLVAQHTSDYHRWVSHSWNGWETAEGKAAYYILR